jgi:GTP pyrophosphokinase
MVKVRSHLPESEEADNTLTKETWLANIQQDRDQVSCLQIQQTLDFLEKHDTQADLTTAIAIADILSGLEADDETLIAGLVFSHAWCVQASEQLLLDTFGEGVKGMVVGLREMSELDENTGHATGRLKGHAEGLRKMLLAIVKDVRVILIKLALQLHTMRMLKFRDEQSQHHVAEQTREIFAPLANRLGIWQVKWELEDLAFRFLQEKPYKQIASQLSEKRLEREAYIANVISVINSALEDMNISAEVTGRPKHIYSIWRKMIRKGVDFDQIFDVRAVRVLVDKIEQCYAVLGVVHGRWQHIRGEFDDYIATPKENMYQSLHTAVIDPDGKTLEIQIRTHEMHEHSELGVASHWRYKEGGRYDDRYERRLHWMRQLLDAKDGADDDLLERFKEEVNHERVYVFTPMGRVIDLPQGATVLDFAYVIHTDVGHRCRGAKVNGGIVPLTYEVQSGETVEVLTAKEKQPNRNWMVVHLGYLRTRKARSKVRSWFRHQDFSEHVVAGKSAVDKIIKRLGVEKNDPADLLKRFKFDQFDDFLASVGRGEVTSEQIIAFLAEKATPSSPPQYIKEASSKSSGDIEILGVDNLLTQMAGCCKPVAGDAIIGFITRGRGVTVHRQDCGIVRSFEGEERDRLIDVSWNAGPASAYSVEVVIKAEDRRGLLHDVMQVLSLNHINVLSTQTLSHQRSGLADLSLTIEISDINQLSRVLDKVANISSILDVYRKT